MPVWIYTPAHCNRVMLSRVALFFYYFDALCVVIEGFCDLKSKDDAVENLLKSLHTDALRRSAKTG
jgi:hypothetical protein